MGTGCCSSDATQTQNSKTTSKGSMHSWGGIPPFELEYFDLNGRALQVRMLSWYCNLIFKDSRLSNDQFGQKKMKGSFKFGSVPVMNCADGK